MPPRLRRLPTVASLVRSTMVLTEWEAVSSLDRRDASESWSPLPQRPSFHHIQLVNATRCANMLFGHDLKSGPWKLSQHVVCANTSSGASSTPRLPGEDPPPPACSLPPWLLEHARRTLLHQPERRTLVLIGDSLAHQLFTLLACWLRAGRSAGSADAPPSSYATESTDAAWQAAFARACARQMAELNVTGPRASLHRM